MTLTLILLEFHFLLECLGMCVFRLFLPWWQWSLVVRARQCIANCGPGVLLVALALPLPPSIAFPNAAHMHDTCTLSHSLFSRNIHRSRHISTNTHSLRDTQAQMYRHIKVLKASPWGRPGDRTRHLGTGCQFLFLRPVFCFGTDPVVSSTLLTAPPPCPQPLALLQQISPCWSPATRAPQPCTFPFCFAFASGPGACLGLGELAEHAGSELQPMWILSR